MPRTRFQWPGAAREDQTPFERFENLAGRVLTVPKSKVDERAKSAKGVRPDRRSKRRKSS